MPGARDASPSPDPVVLAVVLALVAGAVDAVAYLHLTGAFPANQSGNAIVLGIAAGGAGSVPWWVSAVAVASFLAGAASGVAVARRAGARRRPVLLAVELALLLLAFGVAGAASTDGGAPLLGGAPRLGVLVAAGLAMGVQTEVIRRAAGVSLSTTYQTGALARLGETAVGAPGVAGPGSRAVAVRSLAVLGAVVVAYVAGAAVGAGVLPEGAAGLVAVAVAPGAFEDDGRGRAVTARR